MPPYRTKADGRWRYRVRVDVGGVERRISGSAPKHDNTKAAAQGAERAHIARLLSGQEVPKEPRPPAPTAPAGKTVTDFAPTYLASKGLSCKHGSMANKRQMLRDHILPRLGQLELDAVTYAQIEDFKVDLVGKDLAPGSVNSVLAVLRGLLLLAQKRGELAAVPTFEWMKVRKTDPDFLSFDEAEKLVAATDGEWASMVRVALQTGLRHGELVALRWEDVDLAKGEVRVRQNFYKGRLGTPKSDTSIREVPLPERALQALKGQRHLRGPLVWCDEDGGFVDNGKTQAELYRACRRAGLRLIGWHVLRHTYASHLVMRGAPLKLVQEYMGHATIDMTMRYAHLSPEAKSRASVACLDWAGQNLAKGESRGHK